MLDFDELARRRRHYAIDEQCRRLAVWVAIQSAADRAYFAGKSYTRSLGQLRRWHQPKEQEHGNQAVRQD